MLQYSDWVLWAYINTPDIKSHEIVSGKALYFLQAGDIVPLVVVRAGKEVLVPVQVWCALDEQIHLSRVFFNK